MSADLERAARALVESVEAVDAADVIEECVLVPVKEWDAFRSALDAEQRGEAPGHTDLMVTPESVGAFLDAHPAPPPPAMGQIEWAKVHDGDIVIVGGRKITMRVEPFRADPHPAKEPPPAMVDAEREVIDRATVERLLIDAYDLGYSDRSEGPARAGEYAAHLLGDKTIYAKPATDAGASEGDLSQDADWLLRQMETQDLTTLRDIARTYPCKRNGWPACDERSES